MTILDEWIRAAELHAGKVFRCVCRAGNYWGDGVTERAVCHVVKSYAAKFGFAGLGPQDLRRSCANLAILQEESWSRFNSCLGMFPCKQPSVISAANSGFVEL